VEVRQSVFDNDQSISAQEFVPALKGSMEALEQLITADLQVVSIHDGGGALTTRVRYEFVGSGRDFHREQRIGNWELEWESCPNQYCVRKWQFLEETQSRALHPVFSDIASQAFGSNRSYESQLLHGADYWRTVLDGASGIDIYGHNGVSVGDIDNDGYDDLYICQPAGLPNRLFRNRGDGTFDDITEKSGLDVLENTACALFADISNRGHQDLIVVQTNGPVLFTNEGNHSFRRVPNAFKFAQPPQGTFTGAAIADYDRDGWLDIYFCLYLFYQGTDQYKYPTPYYDAENGPPNFLMRNNRDGTFEDVTSQSGLNKKNTRYSFCCGWNDFNRDGWPDLYVVNDFGRKNLYRNNGDGTFTDVALDARVEDVGAGMSVSWFDCNNDGLEDLYVANMWTAAGERISKQEIFHQEAPADAKTLYRKHAMGNSLFFNVGSGKSAFHDVSQAAGVGIGRWSWSSDAWDFDHDGFQDLYVTNGMVSGPSHDDLNSFFWRQVVAKSPNEAKPSAAYEQGWNAINEALRADGTWSGFERNVFFANNGDGTFSDVSGAVALDFLEDGRAFALTDFDHDGRLEVFLKNRNAPQVRALKNEMQELPPSIAFRLQGVKSNRDAIGAVITIENDSGKQTRTLQAGSGFLSQHTKDVFFGLGRNMSTIRGSIRWPSGLVQELRDLPSNHRVLIQEGKPAVFEAFRPSPVRSVAVKPQAYEVLPTNIETWLLAPIAAPDFSLPDETGQIRTLGALRGKPLLLNLWVTRSSACQENLKTLSQQSAAWSSQGLQLLTVNLDSASGTGEMQPSIRNPNVVSVRGNDDVAGIYTILYRYLFDRHRDLSLPTSFLIDVEGDIVKVYQGPLIADHVSEDIRQMPKTVASRFQRALPFSGTTDSVEFHRNYLSYGSVFFQREYFEQAESAFRRAVKDDSESAEALYGLGSVFLKQEKIAEAREAFERATKLHAAYPETLPNAWNNLGLLAAREERTDEAILDFQHSLKLNPEYLIALNNLGNAYRQAKRWDEAQRTFERVLEVNAQDADASYGLAMVFAQKNDTDRTQEYLLQALKYRPAYPEALNNLGILYLRTGKRDEAVARFEESIRVAPDFDQSYLNLARVYALQGEAAKAKIVLQELLKRKPSNAQATKMLEQLGR
jgi:tetratricopeptide (TPR) repeat protein/peroxiredoxin